MSLGGLYMEGLIFGVLWYVEVGRVRVDKECHRLQTKKKTLQHDFKLRNLYYGTFCSLLE